MSGTAIAIGLFLAGAMPGKCPEPLPGSAPFILKGLARAWQLDFVRHRLGRVTFEEPFGPPQGSLNPSLTRFLDGRSSFALLTREISEDDLAAFRRTYRTDPVVIPVAGGAWNRFGYVDAVAIIVNRANPIRRLSFAQLDAVFSATHLRGPAVATWDQLHVAAWRGRPIHIVGGDAWSGAESARALTIRRRVLGIGGKAGAWRPASGSGTDADVVERVGADPLAIGFTGMGHLRAGVRAVAIAAGLWDVARRPTRATIRAGTYPLARTVDLLLPPAGTGWGNAASVALGDYLTGPLGQAVIRRTSPFLPLDPRQLRRAKMLLDARRTPNRLPSFSCPR